MVHTHTTKHGSTNASVSRTHSRFRSVQGSAFGIFRLGTGTKLKFELPQNLGRYVKTWTPRVLMARQEARWLGYYICDFPGGKIIFFVYSPLGLFSKGFDGGKRTVLPKIFEVPKFLPAKTHSHFDRTQSQSYHKSCRAHDSHSPSQIKTFM